MNIGFCGKCKKRVPIEHVQKEGKEYLKKNCPDCGATYELIASDSQAYRKKRELMADVKYHGCDIDCLGCTCHMPPSVVFVETTNRCNMNCPICLTNVPAMGFEFEPRMEYFDKIFKYYSSFEFPPSIQLFGGEPTLREDLLDIIKLGHSYGLPLKLVTNGLKLADPEYCEKVISSGVSVLVSFDGLKREMYQKLRGRRDALDFKLKALENISRHKKGKVVLMTVIDKNMNGDDMPKFLDYCLKNSKIVRGIFPMPLTQVWSEERLDYNPERTTQDDVEKIVDAAVEGKVDFVPLGALDFRNLARMFNLRPYPFLGIHPNCESFTLLISNGKNYVSLSKYLKKDLFDLIREIRKLDASVAKHVSSGQAGAWGKFLALISLGGILVKYANFSAVVGAKGFRAFVKWLGILAGALTGRKFKDVIKGRTNIKDILQILILPFEDDATQESERLEKCASGYTYIDIETDTVKSIPGCIWEKYKESVLRSNAEKYNKEGHYKGLHKNELTEDEVTRHA